MNSRDGLFLLGKEFYLNLNLFCHETFHYIPYQQKTVIRMLDVVDYSLLAGQRISNQSSLVLISPISPTSPGMDWVTITILTVD